MTEDYLSSLASLNWKITMDYLDDAIKELQECQSKLEAALKELDEYGLR